jgi:hypothetical protein
LMFIAARGLIVGAGGTRRHSLPEPRETR